MAKKIGIITFHKAVSFGAAYQAYALQTFLQEKGNTVEIIDYVPKRFSTFDSIFIMGKGQSFFKKMIKFIPFVCSRITAVLMLQRFNRKYLKLSPKTYKSEKQLVIDSPSYDLYLTGSDQVWNLKFDNWENIKPYLFSFTDEKKISYAASMGMSSLDECPDETKKQFLDLLDKYSAISVREESAKSILEAEGISAKWVLDPTFLIDKESWNKLASKKTLCKDPFILVYGLYRNNNLYKVAKSIAAKNGFKIINIADSYAFCSGAENKILISHENLLWYLINAKCVITDSFHGAAISINCNTPVYILPAKRYNTRLESLVKKFNLNERYLDNQSFDIDFSLDMDYSEVNSILRIERNIAYLFLESNI